MATPTERASRFLMQATLGANYSTIEQVATTGPTQWLTQQLNHTVANGDSFLQKTSSIWQDFRARLLAQVGGDSSRLDGAGNAAALPYWLYWRMAWWQRTLAKGSNESAGFEYNSENMVRHRVAQALSEIIVISDASNLELDAEGFASFYDLLYKHAFGSYSDLLGDISLHPCMGAYLTHMNNQKADEAKNIHPDENFAREIMQLFSIGLFELNPDGSRKKDADGNDIPTYTNADITELARVYTGIKAASYDYEWPNFDNDWPYIQGQPVSFDEGVDLQYRRIPFVDMISLMSSDENYHDQGAKRLLNGHIDLPAGQSTVKDIRDVAKQLTSHPSTAPFVAYRLIQQLVTSNPSPSYVQSVAEAFGRNGDLKATVRAILTHDEAANGVKLKSPALRTTQILRAFNAYNDSGKMWVLGERLKASVDQHVMSSPTVFNFYLPDYQPHGAIEDANQVAPEFELHTSSNSVNYANLMYQWFFGEDLPPVSTVLHAQDETLPEVDFTRLTNAADKLKLDLSVEEAMAANGEYDALIERISLLLTGSSNIAIKARIKEAFDGFKDDPVNGPKWVVQTVLFMISISPEFTVLGGS